QRNATDLRDSVLAIFVIINANILRDQATKGIESQPPNRGFYAVLVQFLNHESAPFPAESFPGQVPAAAGHRSQDQNNQKPRRSSEKAPRERARSMRRRSERFLRRFQNSWHDAWKRCMAWSRRDWRCNALILKRFN